MPPLPCTPLLLYIAFASHATSSASKRFPSSAAPCRRAKRNAKSCTESCKIPALIQSWCRVRTEPCKTRRVLTLLTSRRPRALRRRARNSVLVFDLFSDLLSGHPKSDFLEPSGIARILPDGQNFLRSLKKQEFSVELCRFSRYSCGEAFQGRFWDEKSMKSENRFLHFFGPLRFRFRTWRSSRYAIIYNTLSTFRFFFVFLFFLKNVIKRTMKIVDFSQHVFSFNKVPFWNPK